MSGVDLFNQLQAQGSRPDPMGLLHLSLNPLPPQLKATLTESLSVKLNAAIQRAEIDRRQYPSQSPCLLSYCLGDAGLGSGVCVHVNRCIHRDEAEVGLNTGANKMRSRTWA